VTGLVNSIDNLFAIRNAKKQQEEQWRIEQEQRRIEEKRRKEEIERQEEQARQEEIAKQWQADQAALGDYMTIKKVSEIPDEAKEIYFVTYERDHPNYNEIGTIKIKTYALARYSDGSWMMRNDVIKKLQFREMQLNKDTTQLLLGFFTNKQDALGMIGNVKSYFKLDFSVDKNFLLLNNPSNASTKKDDFWNQ
jgi:hypothetical protein